MAKVITDQQVVDEVGKLAGGEQGSVPQVKPVLQSTGDYPPYYDMLRGGVPIAESQNLLFPIPVGTTGTIDNTTGKMLGDAPTVGTALADTSNITTTAPTAGSSDLGQVDATTNIGDVGTASAAQISPAGEYVNMSGVQGTVVQVLLLLLLPKN